MLGECSSFNSIDVPVNPVSLSESLSEAHKKDELASSLEIPAIIIDHFKFPPSGQYCTNVHTCTYVEVWRMHARDILPPDYQLIDRSYRDSELPDLCASVHLVAKQFQPIHLPTLKIYSMDDSSLKVTSTRLAQRIKAAEEECGKRTKSLNFIKCLNKIELIDRLLF